MWCNYKSGSVETDYCVHFNGTLAVEYHPWYCKLFYFGDFFAEFSSVILFDAGSDLIIAMVIYYL